MTIVVRFQTSNMTRAQYQSVHDAVDEAGEWPPPGCLVHVCFGDEQDLRVSEIWESREQLEAFGPALASRITAAGIQMSGEPEIFEVLRLETFGAA